jgi:hypothetical protein
MTDTSNLDELANAISSSSPKIKAYARAQAAATQAQELDIQKALARIGALEQGAETPSPPTSLPFAEAVLSNPVQPAIGATQTSYTCTAGKDYLIDLDWTPRKTLVIGGEARNIHVRNSRFRIDDPRTVGPYWRGGLGFAVKAQHISVTDYFVEAGFAGCTLADGFRIATTAQTKVTLQRARIEAIADTPEAAEHCDSLQVQGPVGRIEIGLATLQAAGVRPPNHGGKCLQIAHEPWPSGIYGGPFSLALDKVNMVGLGEGQGRFGTMFIRGPEKHHVTGIQVGQITETLKEVYAVADGAGATDFPGWFAIYAATPGVVSGTKPNRRITFDPTAHKITGYVQEGRPSGGDFVTRAMLGV